MAKEITNAVLGKPEEILSTDGYEHPIPKHPVDRYGVFSPHQVLLFSCKKIQDAEKYCDWYDKRHNNKNTEESPIHCTIRLMYGIKVKNVQIPKSIHEVWDIKYHPDDDDEIYIPYDTSKWEEAHIPKESKCDEQLITSTYAHNK